MGKCRLNVLSDPRIKELYLRVKKAVVALPLSAVSTCLRMNR